MTPAERRELRRLDHMRTKRQCSPAEQVRHTELARLRTAEHRARSAAIDAELAAERDAEIEMGIDPILWGESVGDR